MKTLLLLRHAKAESPASAAKRGWAGDKDRRLDPRGKQDCAKIGATMKAKGYAPELIIASSAARTRETMECIAPLLGAGIKIKTQDDFYLANGAALLRYIHALNDHLSCVMIVGHNPGLHELACAFVAYDPPTDLTLNLKSRFPTCALAAIKFDQPSWSLCDLSEGTLMDFMYPKAL